MAAPHDDTAGAEQVWETRARSLLADGDRDPELGVRVARDAQRVVAGELDEDVFRQRYQDAFVEEFGVDDRRRLDDGLARPVGRDPDEPSVLSRRAVLAAFGGAAVGILFLGELLRRGAYAAGSRTVPTGSAGVPSATGVGGTAAAGRTLPVQFGMVIDLERCDGCLTCVKACVDENGLSDGVLWPYVFAYQEPGDVDPRYLVRLCQHCTRAPCVLVCPTGARHRRLADGLVLTDYDVCIGCRYCQAACPYGVNVFQWGDPATYGGSFEGERRDARGVAVKGDPPRGVVGKCTFCPLRQDDPERRGTAACVDACPMDALHIGDLNDPDSAPNRYLAQRREEAGGNLPTFRLLEDLGTEPNIIYIGQPPSARAELVEGPWTYEDWGLTEDRRGVLERPEPWFRRVTAEA